MDHEKAVQLGATERYLLGEFSSEEREAFEEHYFECAECAGDVRAAWTLRANARAVFRDEQPKPLAVTIARRSGWREFFTFRPALVSLAVNAALLVGLGVTLWRTEDPTAPRFYPEFGLAQTSRGDRELDLPAGTRFFGARLDLLPGQKFDTIAYEIRDEAGTVVARGSAPAPADSSAQNTLAVPVSKLKAGRYLFVVTGISRGQSTIFGSINALMNSGRAVSRPMMPNGAS